MRITLYSHNLIYINSYVGLPKLHFMCYFCICNRGLCHCSRKDRICPVNWEILQ
jgi:hypothetical protein